MNTTAKLFSGMLLIGAVAIASTGCMTGPGAGQDIGSTDTKISFNGFTANPNQTVYLYGLKGYNDWQYLGQTKTSSYSYSYFGVNWYYWSIRTSVPNSVWQPTGFGNENLAVIQARDSSGNALYTFEPGFYSWFQDYDNLNEMWDDRGSGQAIVIYGDD